MNLSSTTEHILQTIPAQMIPDATDGNLFREYRDFFARHEEALIQGFYDTIYEDPATQKYLRREERSMRENTLRQWYRITTAGHFDQHYWSWQALVGVVHVKHNIPNPVMLAMWGWMINFIQERLLNELPVEEALPLIQILQKLQTTGCALIMENFLLTQREAISRASGLNQTLLERFIHIEIDQLLEQGRSLLQTKIPQAAAS